MNYENLIYSLFCIVLAFVFYKSHVYWLHKIKANERGFFMPMIKLRIIAHWILIIMLSIFGIVYFLEFLI
jgi:hypothetical protein